VTQQLKDLLKGFTAMSSEEQVDKIREIRHSRNIERPAVAKRRQKREGKRSVKTGDKAADLLKGLTPEQRELFLAELRGEG